jgi:sugar phosphate permease
LGRGPQYRWVILAMAFLSVFGAIGFGRFGYSAVLPAMQEALGLTSAAAGSLASWTLVGYTITAAVGGVLASRLGPRLVLTVGMGTTAVGMLITGFSDGLTGASVGRLVTGMGNGMILVPAIGLMAAWFHVRRVGLASSIVPTGSSLAMVLAGPLVPRLIAGGGDEGWRLAWYFFAGVTILLAVANVFVMRDRPGPPTHGRGLLFGRRTGAAHSFRETTASDMLGILRSG